MRGGLRCCLVVVAPRWLTPVAGGLLELAVRHRLVVTLEDGNRVGGVGSRLSQALRDAGLDLPTRDIGIPPRFLDHGTVAEVRAETGLTVPEIASLVVEWLAKLYRGLPTTVPARRPPHRRLTAVVRPGVPAGDGFTPAGGPASRLRRPRYPPRCSIA